MDIQEEALQDLGILYKNENIKKVLNHKADAIQVLLKL